MIPGIVSSIRMQQVNKNQFSNYRAPVSKDKVVRNVNQNNPQQRNNLDYNNRSNKETDLSTKVSTKENLLDYTFLSHRSQLSNTTKDLSKSKDYIFDLMNTWELNIDLIENLLIDSRDYELLKLIQNIKTKMDTKKKLKEEADKIKSRILIEKQIIEELKRKNEENYEYYNDQIKELEENRDGKEEYIMIFEKKLKEVEIYIQKNHKEGKTEFEVFKDFKMARFIQENLEFVQKRDGLYNELNDIQKQIEEISKENENYRHEVNNFSFTGNVEDDLSLNINKDQKDKLSEKSKVKLRQYYEMCKNKVRAIEMKNKLLKNSFNELTCKFKYFNFAESKLNIYILVKKNLLAKNGPNQKLKTDEVKVIEKEENEKEKNEVNVNDRSNINLDITRKIATFMDFSVILNKKQCDETNMDFGLNKTGMDNFGNENWDLSYIGKN